MKFTYLFLMFKHLKINKRTINLYLNRTDRLTTYLMEGGDFGPWINSCTEKLRRREEKRKIKIRRRIGLYGRKTALQNRISSLLFVTRISLSLLKQTFYGELKILNSRVT